MVQPSLDSCVGSGLAGSPPPGVSSTPGVWASCLRLSCFVVRLLVQSQFPYHAVT